MKKYMSFVCVLSVLLSVFGVGVSAFSTLKLGDLNMDGEIDMRDAFALYAFASGGSGLSDTQMAVADINDDGEYDMRDAYQLYLVASGVATLPDDPYFTDPTPGDDVVDGDWT